MTKVKICGITNLEDALLSIELGAHALGFNFYPRSPRYITVKTARAIVEELPASILKVGVFVDAECETIEKTGGAVGFDAVQLHGSETPEFARDLKADLGIEVIKAFGISSAFKPEDVMRFGVDAILFDAYSPKARGGTGETFDWEIAKKVQEIFPKMYLAGGLSENNIAQAIKTVQPFGVDACSRLEFENGKKDKAKLEAFFERIRHAC